ncbi:hypothetical protein Z946_3469 [Sulfitobacter noctilucicola]|nr:hypothetical protein Z946_3469 [Sulfitobacter noctilucicola]
MVAFASEPAAHCIASLLAPLRFLLSAPAENMVLDVETAGLICCH